MDFLHISYQYLEVIHMKLKVSILLFLTLIMLAPSLLAESGSGSDHSDDDDDDWDDDYFEHSYNYKLSGKLFEGNSGTYVLGQKKYAVIFKESFMDGSRRVAKFVIESEKLRDEFALGQGDSRTLKDGSVIFINLITLTNEGSGSSGHYRVELTLVCDQKCQGLPMKKDDSYEDKEKYYQDCKYKCYQSCAAPTDSGLTDAQNKCVNECYSANCASTVQPTPYPYPNPKEQCRLNFNKCTETVKDLKDKQECEEKFNSCLNDISQRPMPARDCESDLKNCFQSTEEWLKKCKEGKLGYTIDCVKDEDGRVACFNAVPSEGEREERRMTTDECARYAQERREQCQQDHESCVKGGIIYYPPSERPISQGSCGEGCSVNGERQKCVPYGTRLTVDGSPSYCDIDGQTKKQQEDGQSANNNYECRSNSARYGVCENVAEQTNIINKIFGWLARIFG